LRERERERVNYCVRLFSGALFKDAIRCYDYADLGIDEWMWSIGRMVVRRVNRSTWRNCVSATLSTTNHTWTALGLNSRLLDDRPAADPLSHGNAAGGTKKWIASEMKERKSDGQMNNIIE
jgi:hypothetical protein